jgi:hypothetical protein
LNSLSVPLVVLFPCLDSRMTANMIWVLIVVLDLLHETIKILLNMGHSIKNVALQYCGCGIFSTSVDVAKSGQ